MFQNISNFNNTSDYLPILNGALLTDLLFLFFIILGIINSPVLRQWYSKYTLSAVMEDVLILVIGIIIKRFFYKYIFGNTFSLFHFTLLAIFIQVIHDFLFYLLFSIIPKGKNKMMDTFKDYAKEANWKAIFGDSCMISLTSVLSSYLASLSVNTNIIVLILTIYIIPYTIYTF
jgi:uncharacterized protein YacL